MRFRCFFFIFLFPFNFSLLFCFAELRSEHKTIGGMLTTLRKLIQESRLEEARDFAWALHQDVLKKSDQSSEIQLEEKNTCNQSGVTVIPEEYPIWILEGIALSLEGMCCSVKEIERKDKVTFFTNECVSACMEVIEEDLQEGKEGHAKRIFYLAVVGMLASDVDYGFVSNWRCMAWFAAFNLLQYECLNM